MKPLICVRPGEFEYPTIKQPELKPGQAIIKIKRMGICGIPTVVIDAAGNLNAIRNAFQYMAHGARYVLIGLQKREICFIHPEFHKREVILMSSRNATKADFDHVIASIKKKKVDPTVYIMHRVLFDCVKDEFEKWLTPTSGVIKAIGEMT